MNAEQINNLLNKLGNVINAKGSQAFSIYVKQKYMTGVTDVAWGTLDIILLIISIIVIYKTTKKAVKLDEEGKNTDNYFCVIVLACIVFVASLFFVDTLTTGIKELVNPQYYALQDIISSVTGK